jgi:uncharacterized protein (DUF697 family)
VSVNKKKLPKAIRRTTDALGDAIAGHGAAAQQETPARRTDFDQTAGTGAAALAGETAGAAAPAASSVSEPFLPTARAQRRSHAHAIVERHAIYSGVGGIIPVPIANIASITAVIVRMVKVLSNLYGIPFQRDRARAIVVGLMGGAMPTGLAAATTSTLVYIIPASGLIGLAVSSLAAVACTRSIGRIFVEHFENGATLHDFSAG